MTTLALLLLSILPRDPTARDAVDLYEVNHFFDDCGRLVFDQAIMWRWCDHDCRHHVVAWRLIKHAGQLPQRSIRGGYTSVWTDGETLRRVDAASVRETFAQYDPELVERDYLPREERRGLSGEAVK